MNKLSMTIVLVTGSTLLGGCQQVSSMFAARPASVGDPALAVSSYFDERIATGKRELQEHRPAQAVVSFRQASYNTATAPEAYNGMAIAYAQMGRQDLARRFFTAAMAADPSDTRFARNLARLDGDMPSSAPERALAQAELPAVAEVPVPAAASQPAPTAATPSAIQSPGLLRASSREVTISTGQGAGLGRNEVRVATQPPRVAGLSGRVHVEGRPQTQAYPVRLALSDVPRGPAPRYPVRIELPQAK